MAASCFCSQACAWCVASGAKTLQIIWVRLLHITMCLTRRSFKQLVCESCCVVRIENTGAGSLQGQAILALRQLPGLQNLDISVNYPVRAGYLAPCLMNQVATLTGLTALSLPACESGTRDVKFLSQLQRLHKGPISWQPSSGEAAEPDFDCQFKAERTGFRGRTANSGDTVLISVQRSEGRGSWTCTVVSWLAARCSLL
ncbi:hypothetical protein WJX81_005244 [Elliptochloris bilobata]|uniref:Uncharacterized protein n=1 Tax=Elliptochloris bilobata TaxID=381761 RepID=A0AAW1RFM1_9CHLO